MKEKALTEILHKLKEIKPQCTFQDNKERFWKIIQNLENEEDMQLCIDNFSRASICHK